MKKKDGEITSLGHNIDKLLVQKSIPLISLWSSNLTLSEFKILDIYISRINSHKPENRTVIFEKGELEKILGVERIRKDILKTRLKNLMLPLEIEDSNHPDKVVYINLFEQSGAILDSDGLWKVKMQCTDSAMKYFFNIEEMGYLRYKLRCIIEITSKYTYLLFIYIEKNKFRKKWTIGLENLKKLLNCDKEETYKDYRYFNQKILKKAFIELNEKTACKFEYKPVKKGRTVTEIEFTMKTFPKLDLKEVYPEHDVIDMYESDDEKELWEHLLTDNEIYKFKQEQINELKTILVTIPENKLPSDPSSGMNDIGIRRYHYIAQQMATMERLNTEKEIKNKFLYLKKILKKDAAESANFNNNNDNTEKELEEMILSN